MSKYPIASGLRRHEVVLKNPPDPPVPDNDGSFEDTPETVVATVRASIERASARQLERITSGTVIAQATHIVTIPYVTGVTTQTVVVFGTRIFRITDVANPDEANRELQLICVESGV